MFFEFVAHEASALLAGLDTILTDVKSCDETFIAAIRTQLKQKDRCRFCISQERFLTALDG